MLVDVTRPNQRNYPPCKTQHFDLEVLTCSISSTMDGMALLCSGIDYCDSLPWSVHNLVTYCPDGSLNKTCVPTSLNGTSYVCVCDSLDATSSADSEYVWSNQWHPMVSSGTGPKLYRGLLNVLQNTTDAQLVEYRIDAVFLIMFTNIDDTNITASSKSDEK